MGNTSADLRVEQNLNRLITKELKKDKYNSRKVIKVLLLGTGDSGKSTIIKQTRNYGGRNYSDSERRLNFLPIMNNIVGQMHILLRAVDENGYAFERDEHLDAAKEINSIVVDNLVNTGISSSVLDKLLSLWDDSAVQKALLLRNKYNVFDSVEYFMDSRVLQRISKQGKDYLPSFDDILNLRNRTIGVAKETFKMESGTFLFIDVGGQRSERSKWIHFFDNVTTVLFVTSISEFNQRLFEDHSVKRIDDSLNVWSEHINRHSFKDIAFVLFLNKWDLFRKKLNTIPFKSTEKGQERFEDFAGSEPSEFEEGSAEQDRAIEECGCHYEDLYRKRIDFTYRSEENVAFHRSIATDTRNFKVIFRICVVFLF